MKTLLITGSNGYIGQNLIPYLEKENLFYIKTLSRNKSYNFSRRIKQITHSDFNQIYNFSNILENVESVVHLAAFSNESKKNSHKNNLNNINIVFLKKLLRECLKFSIKKFIFISTSKVYGEFNNNQKRFHISSNTNPQNKYSKSKLDGEKFVKYFCKKYKIEYLIVRMPMVYGAKNNKNFRLLENYVKLNLPVPLKNFTNSKSILHINNFCDFICQILKFNKFSKKTVNICDDFDVTTADFIKFFIKKHNSKNLKISLPLKLIKFIFYFFGKKNLYIKLFLNHKISNSTAKLVYNWTPKYSFRDYI